MTETGTEPLGVRPRRILVPLDVTPAGDVKIPVAEAYAQAFEADVLLLHVLPPGTIDPSAVLPSEAMARTYLDTVAAYLRGAGIRTDAVLRVGAPATTIIQEAVAREVGLIILGANVRSSWPSALLGSVADQVGRAAPCPVLLVHPRGQPTPRYQLRSFHEDAERAGVLVQRKLGIRTIEVARIVGSVGRYNELAPDFRPRRRRKHDEERYRKIRAALEHGEHLPAIEVYKLGFGYYVLDGHHRVAAAIANGQVEIDANVTEYLPAYDEEAPERFAARRAFEQATQLTEVGAARPDTYGVLLQAIQAYQAEQCLDELPRAASRWFREIYRPLWQMVRARQLSAVFPGERSADIIARLVLWRQFEAPDLSWEEALERFAAAQASGTLRASSRNG